MQAYIISKTDLKVKDVATAISYEINEDTASSAQSNFCFASSLNTVTGDYILLREMYIGIISGLETDKKTSIVTLHSLPVSSIFSRNILLSTNQTISENYMLAAIIENFVASGDAMVDIPYISVMAKTQTPLGITPHNNNGIYSLDTFFRYIACRHHIFTDYELASTSLNVNIENRDTPIHIIDATVADVLNLIETVVSECVSKVTVKTITNIFVYYLFDDGTFGTDPLMGTRVQGKAETIYCENDTDALKAVGDVFAKNKFSHLIEAEIISNSTLYNIKRMELYDRALVKTKNGIYDTYISFKSTKSTAKTVLFKFGDAKLTLTDKLKGGI